MSHHKHPLTLTAHHEVWPLREAFTISRGSKVSADIIVATVSDGHVTGRGEAVPYARYNETVASSLQAIKDLGGVASREALAAAMLPGAARNAVDCALWDYEAKSQGVRASTLAGVSGPLHPVVTAFTLSLDTPDAMAAKARAVPQLPLLKLKLGGTGDIARMEAVRSARPDARLIADANEAWNIGVLAQFTDAAARLGFETIEQPLPEADDEALRGTRWPLPICADESIRTSAELPRLIGLYDAVNIKLDKAGGLTGALALYRLARGAGMKIMVGSMVATSLSVAPAVILAQDADWIDLDGPLLLSRDREHGLHIAAGHISPPDPELWG